MTEIKPNQLTLYPNPSSKHDGGLPPAPNNPDMRLVTFRDGRPTLTEGWAPAVLEDGRIAAVRLADCGSPGCRCAGEYRIIDATTDEKVFYMTFGVDYLTEPHPTLPAWMTNPNGVIKIIAPTIDMALRIADGLTSVDGAAHYSSVYEWDDARVARFYKDGVNATITITRGDA